MSAARHALVKEIFLAVREQPLADRAGYLAQRCEGDEDLEQEVCSLLLRLPKEEGDSLEDDEATPLFPGSGVEDLSIANYKVLQKLGEGGMGEVYEAEQQQPVRRRVALKVLKGGLATREVLVRFESERQALAMMNHPNIARVFEAGTTEHMQPYFAMELVHGTPITDYCDRHRLSNEERLRLVAKVCAGVQHAHQKGIIHRDLKPSNILVAIEDGEAVPKIIDFGVAKATAQPLTEHTLFTQLGQWIGTPEYMSPEQAEMTGLDIDTRSDVYSLGVLLYELLVGARPFDSAELRRVGLDEVRRRIREDEPTRPSTQVSKRGDEARDVARKRRTDVANLVQQLRGDLDWVTMKALEKDRTRRYASPADLAADLERHLRHEPVTACPPSLLYKVGKFVRRNRLAVFAAGVVVSAVLLGLVMTGLALRQTRIEAARAQQVATFLEELIADFNPFLNRTVVSMESLLDQAVERLDTELVGQPLVQARLLRRIGVAYKDLGQFDRAGPVLERSHRLFEAELGEDHLEVATSLYELGWLAWEAGDYPGSLRFKEEGLAVQRRTLDSSDPRLAEGDVEVAFMLRALGEFDRAEDLYTRALAAMERDLGADHVSVARTLLFQGILYNSSGDYRRAREVLERSVRIRTAALGADHLQTAWALRTLARTQRLQGDYENGLATAQRSLTLMEVGLGPEHSDLSFTLATLGLLQSEVGNFAEAQPLLERSLALRERALGADHPEVGLSLFKLSWLHLERGDFVTAGPLLERSLAIARRTLPASHLQTAWRVHALSRQRVGMGLTEEALALQREALEIALTTGGAENPVHAAHFSHLGVLLREMGDLEAARESLEHGLALRERLLGPSHRQVADDLHELAVLYAALGESKRAGESFERALQMYRTTVGDGHPALVRYSKAYEAWKQ